MTGRRIGPYEVREQIGHGGMGEVYLATRADEVFHKRVAIKLLRAGADSDSITRRFRNERQILASLDHANIARFLDGGTTEDGSPYFVMEYIQGQPLTEYCDSHRLSIVERLELFRTVCSAVHYAHQNLIVHRDIKPANILVTPDGNPKLLDFGIAKLLLSAAGTEETTGLSTRGMTPEYASPEQVRGEPITTASDVYSLGVLLYELLTGHRPYRINTASPLEFITAVCEQEPDKPSTAISRVEPRATDQASEVVITPESVANARGSQGDRLRRQLEGDLDNIVLKALRKEPHRRYASPEQLSEDVRRRLEGLPVLASQGTFSYRGWKFIRRHRLAVSAAALIALALVGGTIGTMWQATAASRERETAERRFNDVRRLANSFMFEFHDSIQDLAGSTPARELVVKRALEYLDSLAQEAGDDPSLQRELAEAYKRLADIQGSRGEANLGDTAGALESYRKALLIRQSLAASPDATVDDRLRLASIYSDLTSVIAPELRMDYARWALEIREALAAADPANLRLRSSLGISYHDMGLARVESGDLAGALDSYGKMQAVYEALSADEPGNTRLRRNLALAHKRVAAILEKMGDLPGAIMAYRRALQIDEQLAALDPTNAQTRLDLSFSLGGVAQALLKTDDTAGALEHYRRVLAIREALAAADPKDARTRLALARTYLRIGTVLERLGETPAALEDYRKGLSIGQELSTADPINDDNRILIADAYCAIATLHFNIAGSSPGRKAQSWREARSWYHRSLELLLYLQKRGVAPGVLTDSTPEEVSKQIVRCDEAISKGR